MDVNMLPVPPVPKVLDATEVDEVQRGIITYNTGDRGTSYTGLVEWTLGPGFPAMPRNVISAQERLPQPPLDYSEWDTGSLREEEAKTLPIYTTTEEYIDPLMNQPIPGLVYRWIWNEPPSTLRDIFRLVPKPPGQERRRLCEYIATQVRSLHVHFALRHPGLRLDSFVFVGQTLNDLNSGHFFILDWARTPVNDIYRHPEWTTKMPLLWVYNVWSLLMVLCDIAEWSPYSPPSGRSKVASGMLKLKEDRREKVRSKRWKGEKTGRVFDWAFKVIDKSIEEAAIWEDDHFEIKRFYDKLCWELRPEAD